MPHLNITLVDGSVIRSNAVTLPDPGSVCYSRAGAQGPETTCIAVDQVANIELADHVVLTGPPPAAANPAAVKPGA